MIGRTTVRNKMADDTKIVFVTVGTTSFDKLIETVTKPDVIEVLLE